MSELSSKAEKQMERDHHEKLSAVEELVRRGALESKHLEKYKRKINDDIDKMLTAHNALVKGPMLD